MGREDKAGRAFDAEIERLRAAHVPGESGRLRELFDFLASRGPDAPSASQAEIADVVFGQTDTGADDATVRVYIHRLRKRLDEHYATQQEGSARLTIPAGAYALRLAGQEEDVPKAVAGSPRTVRFALLAAVTAILLAGAFLAGRWLAPSPAATNAMWQPFIDSPRPKLIVVGDYYMFGEMDPVSPERGRLIRDFRVNSPNDLSKLQEKEPQRYGNAEDVGLNYLPFSVAYGLQGIAPILAGSGRQVSVIAASQLEPDMLNYFDVVYIGLFSGMGLMEDINFMNSNFGIGDSYDELIDSNTGKSYVSEEARNLPSSMYYNDYGYIARFKSPGGALVAVVAGARDTGLRGVSPLVSRARLPDEIERVAKLGSFEALIQITGQKGADVSDTLLQARPRP